jgi:hypothetical protein
MRRFIPHGSFIRAQGSEQGTLWTADGAMWLYPCEARGYCEGSGYTFVEYRDEEAAGNPWLTRSRDDLLPVLKKMEMYGGGFAGSLAAAWFKADGTNDMLLRRTFPHVLDAFADAPCVVPA